MHSRWLSLFPAASSVHSPVNERRQHPGEHARQYIPRVYQRAKHRLGQFVGAHARGANDEELSIALFIAAEDCDGKEHGGNSAE